MDVDAYVFALQERLNLRHWDIQVDSGWGSGEELEEGLAAHVVFNQAERTATIRVANWCEDVRGAIRHEMLHILLTDLEFLGCNGRSVEMMEAFNRELERVIEQVANALAEGEIAMDDAA
jgi:hypothetical protein